MSAPKESAPEGTGAGMIKTLHHDLSTVAEARQRLKDAIIAVGLPCHQGTAIFAAADSYARAMRDAGKAGAA